MDSPMEEMMSSKCAHPDLQLDVDIMSLDFLVHRAVTSVLGDRKRQQGGLLAVTDSTETTERALTTVDTSIEIFRHNHPVNGIPATTQFRLDLLKFTTLFCRRLVETSTTPSLQALTTLRKAHLHRAQTWRKAQQAADYGLRAFQQANELPLPHHHLQQCRRHVLTKFGGPASSSTTAEDFYGTEASLSLLDLLPSFMYLSASRAQLDAAFGVSRTWMQLAGEFMLQSALESVLCFGSAGEENVMDAFAWGYVAINEAGDWEKMSVEELEATVDSQLAFDESGLDLNNGKPHVADAKREDKEQKWEGEEMVNLIFKADDDDVDERSSGRQAQQVGGSEVEGWKEVREDFLKLLKPAQGLSLVNHLVQTAAEYPVVDFESKVIGYLEALSQSIEAPILVQLERGQLAALDNSVDETNKFKQKVGLGHWVTKATTA